MLEQTDGGMNMEILEQRERLIELIGSKVCEDYSPNCDEWQPHSCEKCYANDCRIGELADYILSNGVIVPPCKVGDTAYYIYKRWGEDYYISECKVRGISTDYYGKETQIYLKIRYTDYNGNKDNTTALLGRNVFLSIKEAEKELERLKSGGSNEYINKD